MGKGELHDYIFGVLQEEECLIWDTSVTNPIKWLDEYCDDMERWKDEGTWLSSVIVKMLDSYKE